MAACGRGIEPIVKTLEGLVKGRVLNAKTPRGGKYFSFQGIPYAQPPVGPLRFAAPKRVEPWTGVKNALKEGPICPSLAMITREYEEESNEDCLYLNVYTSQLPGGDNTKRRPVMVWIHGGGFFVGSGNSDFYGPDHLVGRDVVIVTLNYRLGALGFLSLQNEACPGNNGLKDQVEALRWVQRNISAFGGDPDNVTVFGESAGGAAVQYLMLSPLTKGLFHRAITQSASAMNPWARSYEPVSYAFKMGELLGMQTSDKDKLLEFLRAVPARTLVHFGLKPLKELQPDWYYLFSAFSPVVEPPSPDAFLSEPLEELIAQGRLHDVPYMLGVNTLEGLIMVKNGLKPIKSNEDYEKLLPVHPNLRKGSPLADSILEQIKAFYFPNGYDQQSHADILSAIYFTFDNDQVLIGLGNAKDRKSKTYFYEFTLEGKFSLFKDALGFGDFKGTLHADELAYLMYSNMFELKAEPGSAEEAGIESMTKLWTDFAKTGDPTPVEKLWPAYNNVTKPYLDIGNTLVPKENANAEQMAFWRDIFQQIRDSVHAKL